MALIRTKYKQLRGADVRFISLVDRAATRIPFRVLKRNEGDSMGIDLTKVFKSDNNPEKPFVSALVVFAQKDEKAGSAVLDAIKNHGFTVDRVVKSDEGATLVFKQTDEKGEVLTVRLSEHLLVDVANLVTPSGFIGDMVKEHGFLPDLQTATDILHDELVEVSKSEKPQEGAEALLTSYAEYLNQLLILPANSFKLDAAIADIIQKCECADKKPAKKDDGAPAGETPEQRKKRIASHPPSEMAPADEDDDQKGPPEGADTPSSTATEEPAAGEPVEKADDTSKAILAALTGLQTTVAGLATKVDGVVSTQDAQKKVLDDVVKKADTLTSTLKGTVVAPVTPEDKPAGPAVMRVEKADNDPRTGNFDTAFLRRRK